ncbi:MAG: hypothetical protein AAFO69_01250 [Bacteroidota bacterium]
MQRNILVIYLYLPFIFLSGCEKHYPEHAAYALQGTQTGYSRAELDEEPLHFFDISLDLTAKLDSLPPFYLMTCSWGSENAITNHDEYYVGYHGCNANSMWYASVRPGEILDMKTRIGKIGEFDPDQIQEVRVGIVVVDTVEFPFKGYFTDEFRLWEEELKQFRMEKHRVVWSKPIELRVMDEPLKKRSRWKIDPSGSRRRP